MAHTHIQRCVDIFNTPRFPCHVVRSQYFFLVGFENVEGVCFDILFALKLKSPTKVAVVVDSIPFLFFTGFL